MKSERRHELQHNDLLTWVNGIVESVKPYSTLILLLLVAVTVVGGGWRWWSRRAAAESAYAWDDLFNAMNSRSPADVNEVAELRPGSNVAQWAAVVAGDMYLSVGCQELFQSKATAAQELRKAVDSYLSVLKESRSSVLRQRATFGLARAYESLAGTRQSEGELDKAIQHYGEVIENWPDGAYAEAARRRLEDLERQSTKEFYDKLALHDPQPAYSDQPGPGRDPLKFDPDMLDAGKVEDFSKALGIDLDEMDSGEKESSDESAATEDDAAEAGPALKTPAPAGEGAPKASAAPSNEPAAPPKTEVPGSESPEPAPAAKGPSQ